jgi:hypothetical protein
VVPATDCGRITGKPEVNFPIAIRILPIRQRNDERRDSALGAEQFLSIEPAPVPIPILRALSRGKLVQADSAFGLT